MHRYQLLNKSFYWGFFFLIFTLPYVIVMLWWSACIPASLVSSSAPLVRPTPLSPPTQRCVQMSRNHKIREIDSFLWKQSKLQTFKGVCDDVKSQVKEMRKAARSDMCYWWMTAAGVYDILVYHMSPSSSPAFWKMTSLFYIFMIFCLPHRSISPMYSFLKTDHLPLSAFTVQEKPHTYIMCLWLKSVLWAVSEMHPKVGLQKPTTYGAL